jgi:hypothetical protein
LGKSITGKGFHMAGGWGEGISRRVVISGLATAGAGTAIVRAPGMQPPVTLLDGSDLEARPATLLTNAGPVFRPEDFGARGDGETNDTAAFRHLADAVNRAGGGRIVLARAVYLVGEQDFALPDSPYVYAPRAILRLSRCARAVTIEGNGATLRCAPGLRYGTFDKSTGRRVDLPMPNTSPGTLATPYDYMVIVELCRGAVGITDLELDGNLGTHRIGGPWGDTGRQIACDGLFLRDNTGDEIVRNLHSHHHGRDGLMLAGPASLPAGGRRSFTSIRSEWNGRQGCSLIGGSGYSFTDCRFAHTGRGPVASPPGAGFDIEAESAPIRNIRFDRCVFEDNFGCGLVADSGDSADVKLANCRFVGTTSWSTWTDKPGFRFDQCEIVGACVRFFSSPDPLKATRFYDCVFTDSPARSANRKVYLNGPMANAAYSRNVLFARCRFDATHGAQLPWSTAVIYESCTMRQSGPGPGYPRGVFRGTNRIDGAVDIGASAIQGRLVLNGRIIAPRA